MVQLSIAWTHPGCEVSCHGTGIVGSSVIHQSQPDSVESCIMLQNRPTRGLIAKFLQHSVFACSMRISCCRGRTLQTMPRTGMCKPLMPDVVSLGGPTFGFTMREFSMVSSYMENLEKPHNCQNWGVGTCTGMGTCSGQYGKYKLLT